MIISKIKEKFKGKILYIEANANRREIDEKERA